jgi:UV DNA damage endonuclease
LDSFHHQLLSNDESLRLAHTPATLTWNQNRDGLPIVDYSTPHVGNDEKTSREERAIMLKAIDGTAFKKFLKETEGLDFEVMLQIKDKEKERSGSSQDFRFQILITQLH